MDQYRSAKEFLQRLESEEFDGRLYETIANLPTDELQQIVGLAEERRWPTISSDAPRARLRPRGSV